MTDGTTPAIRRWPRLEWCAAGAIVVSFVVACIRTSRVKPYWADEIFSWVLATQESPARMLQAIIAGTDTTPPLYHLLAWGWMRLGGGEHWLRVFTSLALGGAVAWLLLLLSRVWGTVAGVVGVTTTAAVSGLLLYQNAEARFYGLYPLVFVAALAAATRLAREERPSRGALVLNAVAQAALAYVHVFGPLYGAALFAALAWPELRARRPRWPVWASFAAGWATFALWLPALANHMEVGRPESWVPLPTGISVLHFYLLQVQGFALWFGLVLHAAARYTRAGGTPGSATRARRLAIAATAIPVVLFAWRMLVAGDIPEADLGERFTAAVTFMAGAKANRPWVGILFLLGLWHVWALSRWAARDEASGRAAVDEPPAVPPRIAAERKFLVRLAVVLFLVPPLVFVLSHTVTSVFVRRYMLPTLLATPIVVAALLGAAGDPVVAARRRGGRVALGLLVLLAIGGLSESQRAPGRYRAGPIAAQVARELAPAGVPVATQDMLLFLQGARYLGADTTRLAFLLDSSSTWSTPRRRGLTVEYKLMDRWRAHGLSGRIVEADGWLCRQSRFVFVEAEEGESPLLHRTLAAGGWNVRRVHEEERYDFYLVERRGSAPSGCARVAAGDGAGD